MATPAENTVLYRLTQKEYKCDSSFVSPGGTNTTASSYDGLWHVQPTTWRSWNDFNYETLANKFKKEINKEFTGTSAAESLLMSRAIFNEACLDRYLHKDVVEVVNEALYCVQPKGAKFHISEGSRCPANNKPTSRLQPDWGMVQDVQETGKDMIRNALVGDTKLNVKWSPKTRVTDKEWQRVLSQITTYMAENNCRYGFIITEAYLVVLRLSYDSLVTNDTVDWHDRTYDSPEYCAVPWITTDEPPRGKGKGKATRRLTAKLALFFLALLASEDRKIARSYPPLDPGTEGEEPHEPGPSFADARDDPNVGDRSTESASTDGASPDRSGSDDVIVNPPDAGVAALTSGVENMSLGSRPKVKRIATAGELKGKAGEEAEDDCPI
ncbi:hypothetical protein PG993_012458 [Apiospora rasikravindrae]|uniref:Uncharacterized protein n=1 Tax=Apiospora rasikravindrae TaxID=990691 RepID=A0ABR1S2J5_9PEZI